jgi:hypothetical protein
MLAKTKIKAPEEAPGPSLVLNLGAPGRTRTRNPWVRSPVLYPLSYRRMGKGLPDWGERRDSNPWSPVPQTGALDRLATLATPSS